MADESSGDAIIEEFQRRRREFRRPWNQNFLVLGLPGFLVFMTAVMTNTKVTALVGIAVILVAAARGATIVLKYQRCPVCDSVQSPGIQLPYQMCRTCGARLSRGVVTPWRGDVGQPPR
jgi:hypothetical protein